MDEHARRATRTPNFPIPLFEQRCSGDVYPKAEPDFLPKKERTHIFCCSLDRLDRVKLKRIPLLQFFDFRSFYSLSEPGH